MSKITITRLLDTAQLMTTTMGQESPAFVDYLAQLVEQSVRTLRNGITYADNVDCDAKTVTLTHGVAQAISASKTVMGVLFTRLRSQTYLLEASGWWYGTDNRLYVAARFGEIASSGTPPTAALAVDIVLLY